jgi:electron transfer flavoprotein alpha subunit
MVHSLVIIEHDGRRVKRGSLSAITLARQLGGSYALVVIGHAVSEIAESLRNLGASSVFVADSAALAEPLADRYAAVLTNIARQVDAKNIVATSSTYTKDILPRVAALLDAPMLTDVTSVEIQDGDVIYHRPICAGSLSVALKLQGAVRVLTARGSAFAVPEPNCQMCPIESVQVDATTLPSGTQFISRQQPVSTRPELTEARVVVSGGRPLKDKETFDRLIGGLADGLGGAVGATRAAVDAGLAPNDCQIGQTGKTVAPELYLAIGISGSVQHLAGIKDSKVIVAINRDPEAPIFQMATYGLVGDLHEVVPHLMAAVRSSSV